MLWASRSWKKQGRKPLPSPRTLQRLQGVHGPNEHLDFGLVSTSWYLLLLLDPYNICALLCPSLYEMFPWYHYFSWRDLWSFPFYCFPLSLCTDHWGRLSYLCAILWNSAFKSIFPFLLCFLLLLFSQLFVRPPQTTILPFCISFSWWWSWSPHPVQCHKLPSIVLQALCLPDLESIHHLHCIIIWDLI